MPQQQEIARELFAEVNTITLTSETANVRMAPTIDIHPTNEELQHVSTTTEQSKFFPYHLKVDPAQGDKATEIKLCSFRRPHMRAFHFAWWSYHVAFLMWFSITPLLLEVQKSLDITTEEIWTSSIAAVSGTIIMRFILGPFCDKFGSRIPMGIILFCSAIPTAMTGLVNTATGLSILRFFIGIGGSTFVMAQYWTTCMFSKEWVGTANATVGGWGNLGGGVTQLLVGSFLFPVLKYAYNDNAEQAWRTACVFPALLGLGTAFCVIRFADDSPKGNYSKLKKTREIANVNVCTVFKHGACNLNTWLIFIQYACCFGVEITMNNAAAIYFGEKFDLKTEDAAAVASIFGWMNIFARGLGGFVSDKMNSKLGLRGRLIVQSVVLLVEGAFVVTFAYAGSLASSIVVLIFFSIFVQMAEGSSYGIVPYIDPPVTGSISGIIGAGGNVGAVAFGLCFRQLSSKTAFVLMGFIIMASSTLSIFVNIDGHPRLVGSGVSGGVENTGTLSNNIDTPEKSDYDTEIGSSNDSPRSFMTATSSPSQSEGGRSSDAEDNI